jgi:DNA-binding NarL/FixJ family response regulator
MDIQSIIRDAGGEVIGVAVRGEDAITLAAALRPDVVLLDVHLMGAMDGIEAARAIGALRGVAVIFVTAHGDADTLRRMFEVVPAFPIIKPILDVQLREAIVRACRWTGNEWQSRYAKDRRGTLVQSPATQHASAPESSVTFVASGLPDTMPVERFAPVIRHVFNCWRRHAKSGEIPTRQDIDPINLGIALPSVALWDVAGEAYVCRLAGTRICDMAEREVRDLRAEMIMPDPPHVTRAEFGLVCKARHLHYCERPINGARKFRSYARLLLPLSSSGKAIDMLLTVLDLRHV